MLRTFENQVSLIKFYFFIVKVGWNIHRPGIPMLLLLPLFAKAQSQREFDSLRRALKNAANDTVRMIVSKELAWEYEQINGDSCFFYAKNTLFYHFFFN